jgi:hypothetical protein
MQPTLTATSSNGRKPAVTSARDGNGPLITGPSSYPVILIWLRPDLAQVEVEAIDQAVVTDSSVGRLSSFYDRRGGRSDDARKWPAANSKNRSMCGRSR